MTALKREKQTEIERTQWGGSTSKVGGRELDYEVLHPHHAGNGWRTWATGLTFRDYTYQSISRAWIASNL
jgi:hypothetical protein